MSHQVGGINLWHCFTHMTAKLPTRCTPRTDQSDVPSLNREPREPWPAWSGISALAAQLDGGPQCGFDRKRSNS